MSEDQRPAKAEVPAMEEPLPSGGPGQGYEVVEKADKHPDLQTRDK